MNELTSQFNEQKEADLLKPRDTSRQISQRQRSPQSQEPGPGQGQERRQGGRIFRWQVANGSTARQPGSIAASM